MTSGFITFVAAYKYLLIVIAAIVEGPIVMMGSGFLIRLGHISFFPAYAALMAGDLIGDVGWYAIGYYFGNRFVRRFGKFFSITEEGVQTVERVFHRHKNWILLISKMTMGFGFAVVTLLTAGLVRIPFRRYLTLNAIGQFVWTGVLLAVGYFFGHLYTLVNSVLARASAVAGVVVIFLLLVGYGKYIKNEVTNRRIL